MALLTIPPDAIAGVVALLGIIMAALIREIVKVRERLARLEEFERLQQQASK